MKTAIYPGTFDPVTNGHLDVVERGSRMFDHIIITVARNAAKTPLFDADERARLIEASLKTVHCDGRVSIDIFEGGLIVDYARNRNATAIIRGLRAISDFEYEFQMALVNRRLHPGITTVFLMPHEKYTYLNSSIVKELASYHGDISHFVTPIVEAALAEKHPRE